MSRTDTELGGGGARNAELGPAERAPRRPRTWQRVSLLRPALRPSSSSSAPAPSPDERRLAPRETRFPTLRGEVSTPRTAARRPTEPAAALNLVSQSRSREPGARDSAGPYHLPARGGVARAVQAGPPYATRRADPGQVPHTQEDGVRLATLPANLKQLPDAFLFRRPESAPPTEQYRMVRSAPQSLLEETI